MGSQLLFKTYHTPLTKEIQICITPPHDFALKHQQQLLPGWNSHISYLILLLQQSAISLQENTGKVIQEKDQLRKNFLSFGRNLISSLRSHKYQSDLFDPRTGLALFSNSTIVWDDSAAVKALLNYPVIPREQCSLLIHPVWQNNVYPSTIVTSAPGDIVQLCTEKIIADHQWN